MSEKKVLSEALAEFATLTRLEDIPQDVRQRAKLLMLDAIGAAFAATKFDFARKALAACSAFGSGESDVIGMPEKLGMRDAILMNAVLVHGLDYDDTYLPGSVHLTASCVPTVLGVGAAVRASGEALLAAAVLGLESAARLGAGGKGGFLRAGFHATSICGIFGCTLLAGRLMKLTVSQLVMAQGIALSMASGNMQPMQDGSWTKRMHPGLAGASAVTAATFGRQEYVGPRETYEGRFGVYVSFLGPHAKDADPALVTAELGERWEFVRSSIKLFPACHQSHAFFNAAIELNRERRLEPEDIASIRVRVAEPAVPLICEPLAVKRKPDSSYAAQFSLPYGIAACLTKGRFGLSELEESSFTDPALVSLAHKVDYEIDPNPGFPRFRSGEVIVKTKAGETLSRREAIKPDEPASAEAIVAKFMDNTAPVASPEKAARIRDAVLGIEKLADARELTRLLAG